MNYQVNKKLKSLSLHPILSILCYFTFVCPSPYLDTYSLSSVDPLHLFHLDVLWLLKDNATERLRCTTKTTDHYKSTQRAMRTFANLHTSILREVNTFIDEFTTKSDDTQLVLYIRNTEEPLGLNGSKMTVY